MPAVNLTPPIKQPTDPRQATPFSLFADDEDERNRAEYRRVFNDNLDRLLNDPAIVTWLDTPIRRRPHNPHLSKWQVYNLQMRLEDRRLSQFREALEALMAEKPAEVLVDEELNPKPARGPINNDESRPQS